jgi:hypothetical protein
MKKSIYILIAFLSFTALQAQDLKLSELPAPVQSFLKKHFKSAFKEAKKDKGLANVTYDVTLMDGTEIEFSSTGEWREVEGNGKAIPTSFMAGGISSYVKTNYPKTAITKIALEIMGGYAVNLSNGKELEFNKKGEFLKVIK